MDNPPSSGYSKTCLVNFSVPTSNQDLIPDAYIGTALKQCSTPSYGLLTNIANKARIFPNQTNNLIPPSYTTPITQHPIVQSTAQHPIVQSTVQHPIVQDFAAALGLSSPNPNAPERFLAITQSGDQNSLCITYNAIFWLIIIIIILAILYRGKYIKF